MVKDVVKVVFGAYDYDFSRQELRRRGVRVPLARQPTRVLEYFLKNGDRLVTRHDLRELLWGSAFVDHDKGINFCIRQVRSALGDAAVTPQYIQTVPRRGYRFLPRVLPLTQRIRRRYAVGAAIGVAVTLGAMVALVADSRRIPTDSPMPDGPRLAHLQGEFFLQRGEAHEAARRFELALTRRPGFSESLLGLAKTIWMRRPLSPHMLDSMEIVLRASAKTGPANADTHHLLGHVQLYGRWNWEKAQDQYERAITLNPGNAEFHVSLAKLHALAGEYQRALPFVRSAHMRDPVSPRVNTALGWVHYFGGAYEQAVQTCRRVLEIAPRDLYATSCLVDALEQAGRIGEAAATGVSAMKQRGALLATPTAQSDREQLQSFRQWELDWIKEATRLHSRPARLALAYARAGYRSESAAALDEAIRHGSQEIVYLAREVSIGRYDYSLLVSRLPNQLRARTITTGG